MKNHFKEDWINASLNIMKRRFPDKKESEIKDKLKKIFEEKCVDKKAVIDNNYLDKRQNTSLLAVYDFINDVKPIIAGNGVLFKNHHQAENPDAEMLNKFLTLRKEYKRKMFEFPEGTYEFEAANADQLNEKQNANSYYGCNGNKYSFFYNLHTATSITSSGQSLISTTENAYEYFMGNAVKFIDGNDFIWYMNNILNEKYKLPLDFLPDITLSTLEKRLKSMFLKYNENYDDIFYSMLNSLTKDEIKKVYFKNNLYRFSLIPYVKDLWYKVFDNVEDFKNPYDVPENIKPYLDEIWELMSDYVLYNYSPIERIDRLKFHKRKSVVVVDTDSNMITLDPFVIFIREKIYPSDIDDLRIRFASINSIAYILDKVTVAILTKYTKRSNIPKEFRGKINMKNEFLFSRIILAPTKKRYITSVRLKEGHEIFPEKVDIKGHDFRKSSTREATMQYFENIIHKELLEKRDIDVSRIIKLLEEFENVVRTSLLNGEKDFLIPISPKELEAYKDNPFSEQSIRAVIAWNAAETNMPISLPNKVDMVKVKLEHVEDLDDMKDRFPEQYKGLYNDIFNSKNEYVKNKGVSVIAIPRNIDYIPEWVRPYIDFETLINDNVSRFHSVLKALGITLVKTKHNVKHFSNILYI